MKDWKDDLDLYLKEQKKTKKELKHQRDEMRKAVKLFIQTEVFSAFNDLKKEFKKHKREVEVEFKKDWAVIIIKKNKHKEFVYEVNINMEDGKLLVSKSIYIPNEKGKLKLGVEGKIRNLSNSMQIGKIEKDDIINDFLDAYKSATRIK